jgi:predicted amidohydrolase
MPLLMGLMLLLVGACQSGYRVNDYTDGQAKRPETFRAAVLHLAAEQGSRDTRKDAQRDLQQNAAAAHTLIRLAAERGADIVITPEYGNTGNAIRGEQFEWLGTCLPPLPCDIPLHELDLEGLQPFVRDYARLAAELKIWIVTSVIECDKSEGETRHYNVGLVLDDRGCARARYRKINLWRLTESRMDAGMEPTTFDTPFGRFGMLICSDALHPGLWSELVEDDSDFLVVQSHWLPSPYLPWMAMGVVADTTRRPVLFSNQTSALGAGGAGIIHPGFANDDSMSIFSGPGIVITDLPRPKRTPTARTARMR